MEDFKILLCNLDRLHTTELGAKRIRRNLCTDVTDVVSFIRERIEKADRLTRRGKNFYAESDGIIITINAGSLTIITAHRI